MDLQIAVLCVAAFLTQVDGLIVSGTLRTSSSWVFLARFCFKSDVGSLAFKVVLPKKYDNITNIIPYNEEEWPQVYPKPDLTCGQKKSIIDPGLAYITRFNFAARFSGCSVLDSINNGTEVIKSYQCVGRKSFPSFSREKWWYIVMESCPSTQGLDMTYQLTLTNGDEGNVFLSHYSADEFGIIETDIVFLVIYVILTIATLYVTYQLKKMERYHITYQVYTGSLVLQLSSLCVLVGYWAAYGRTGVPTKGWKYFGTFLELWATIMFIVVLLLLAKGYTVTRSWISTAGKIKMAIVVGCYVVAAAAVFGWDALSFDPGLVLYIYDSIPGYILIAVRMVAWLWFLYAFYVTFKKFEDRRSFYVKFVIYFTLWFLAGPIVTLIGISAIPAWNREKIVNAVNLFVIFYGHVAFMVITWPSLANKNFPFTIKRSTVTIDGRDPEDTYAPKKAESENVPMGSRSASHLFSSTPGY